MAHFGMAQPEQLLALMALLVWAFRLALFLFWTRLRKGHLDARYQRLSAAWSKPKWQYLANFLMQGAWLGDCIALVFYTEEPRSVVFVCLVGHQFKSVGDCLKPSLTCSCTILGGGVVKGSAKRAGGVIHGTPIISLSGVFGWALRSRPSTIHGRCWHCYQPCCCSFSTASLVH